MRNLDIEWIDGFTEGQLDEAEQVFGFLFPPDLRRLLLRRRPSDFYDWADHAAVQRAINWPFEGLLFDIEIDQFWLSEWGVRPKSPDDRAAVLRDALAKAPRLIPLRGHRYLPATPSEEGNPVLSVYQSDIIYYGADLSDYLDREYGRHGPDLPIGPVTTIPFWSALIEMER